MRSPAAAFHGEVCDPFHPCGKRHPLPFPGCGARVGGAAARRRAPDPGVTL